jgi:phage shock protein PspC (stress-responsive transcriptional regulator)
MNKVITINLGGNAYQLEEGGYDALRAYLETASARLAGNPDRDEILSDIELAIAEKFRALLASRKNVVETKDVSTVLADMGPIDADSGEAQESAAGAGASSSAGASAGAGGPKGTGAKAEPKSSSGTPPPRRLYRISEGAMLSGVCNGIAAYLNMDPTFVRLGFILLTIFWGTGLLVYLVMAFVVPEATTPEQKAAASGMPETAQEFIRRAKAGYYNAMKNFPDRKAQREWSRQFKRQMRANAGQWRAQWGAQWSGCQAAQNAPIHPGMGFTLPFLSLLNGAATVLLVCILISLFSTGEIFGRSVPGDLPVWAAAVMVVLVFGVLTSPLKMARHAIYRNMGQPHWTWSIIYLLDAAIWLAVVAAIVCLTIHFFPQVCSAFQSLPNLVQHAADDIKNWWNQK